MIIIPLSHYDNFATTCLQVEKKKVSECIKFEYILVSRSSRSIYAVKVQRSLAPLSRFRGSHITILRMNNNVVDFRVMRNLCHRLWNLQAKLTKREPHFWDPRQRTTWSGHVTSDFNSVLAVRRPMAGEIGVNPGVNPTANPNLTWFTKTVWRVNVRYLLM